MWKDRQCNESAVVLISSPPRHTIGPNGKNPPKIRFKNPWNSCWQSDKFSICYAITGNGNQLKFAWFLRVKSQHVNTNFLAGFSHLEPQCAMKSSFILVLSLCATLTITEASGNRSVLVNFCQVLCEELQSWSKISKLRCWKWLLELVFFNHFCQSINSFHNEMYSL